MIRNKIRASSMLLAVLIGTQAKAEITLFDKEGWKLQTNGFIQTDLTRDTTRSFREAMGSGPIERFDNAAGVTPANGANGRTAMSARNSRMGFVIFSPIVDDWKSKAVIEFDFKGNSPSPGTAGVTESQYYSNPAVRGRHLYFQLERNDWQVTVGQTWSLFGWQPNYTMSTVGHTPFPGAVFARSPQARVMKTFRPGETTAIQTALAVVRPPQADGNMPDLQAGARIQFGKRSSGYAAGSASPRKIQPTSIGVSYIRREFEVANSVGAPYDISTHQGYGVSVSAMLPLIASSDGVSTSNTLTLVGDFTMGTGYADQMSYTGNLANPLNAASTTTNSTSTAAKVKGATVLDGGIGDYDAGGAFHTVDLQSYTMVLQYHLPKNLPYFVDAGFGQLRSKNVGNLVGTNGATSSGKVPYDQTQAWFANVFREITPQIRTGLEYAHAETHYRDEETTKNDRYQISAWYAF